MNSGTCLNVVTYGTLFPWLDKADIVCCDNVSSLLSQLPVYTYFEVKCIQHVISYLCYMVDSPRWKLQSLIHLRRMVVHEPI